MHPQSVLQPAEGGLTELIRSLLDRAFPSLQPTVAVAAGAPPVEPARDIARGVDAFHNSGGPRSRTRTEPLRASLFPARDSKLPDRNRDRCPLGVRRVGDLWAVFNGRESLRDAALGVLAEQGFAGPDEAFAELHGVPRTRLHCRRAPGESRCEGAIRPGDDPLDFLRKALVLGKCCRGLYDPERPVILTETRLRRRFELYEIRESFYGEES